MSGLRFSKRIQIAPGVRMNLNRRSTSFTFGGKGLHYTVGSKGTRASAGIPGTGLSYSQKHAWANSRQRGTSTTAVQRQAARIQHANERIAKAPQKEQAALYTAHRIAEVEHLNSELDEHIAGLKGLLPASLGQNVTLDFEALKDHSSFPAFNIPPELLTPAALPAVESYLPRPLGWPLTLIAPLRKRYERKKTAGEAAYGRALEQHSKSEADNMERIDTLYKEYAAKQRAHDDGVRAQHMQISEFEDGYRRGRPEDVVDYVRRVLSSEHYVDGFMGTSAVAYNANAREITIDQDLPSYDLVPEEDRFRYIKSRDEIAHTQRAKTERRAMYAQLISAAAIVTLHDVFTAGTTGQVYTITFNGYASGLDSGTGNMVRACVISVRCTRIEFESLNLAQIDSVECLEHLGGRVSRNPAEFMAVPPLAGTNVTTR